MKIKRITAREELKILNLIDIVNAEYVDCGAARFLVKPYKNSKLDIYLQSIGLDNNKTPFVIKIAMGPGGLAQTQAEITTYLECKDVRNYLADIYAYGIFLEFMEEVDANFYDHNFFRQSGNSIDQDNFEEELFDENRYAFLIKYIIKTYNLNEDDALELCLQGFDAFCALQEIFGCTSDVGQIGTNLAHNIPKAYDYGFFYDIDCSSQTSDMDGEDYEGVYEYYIPEILFGLHAAIEEGQELNDKLIHIIVKDAERNYFESTGNYEDYDDPYDHDEEYYQVCEEENYSFNRYFDSESDAIAFAKTLPIEDKAYVEYVYYPADFEGNSLNDRNYETIWDYTEMEDTRYWEEDNHNSEDMKDTSFWEKQDE